VELWASVTRFFVFLLVGDDWSIQCGILSLRGVFQYCVTGLLGLEVKHTEQHMAGLV
jgi:hypothetical protein